MAARATRGSRGWVILPMLLYAGHSQSLLLLLVQIALILALSRVLGKVFTWIGQPLVMGEMVAGVLLGPSLLGWAWPEGFAAIFPTDGVAALNMVSQIGVVFFLFLIGLELDPALVRARGRSTLSISIASIVAPFLLGAGVTVWLYGQKELGLFHGGAVPLRSAAIFMGAAMSITAFPVLARILTERNLHKTQLGATAVACAAVNDVAAWCLLAVVVAVAQIQGTLHAAWVGGMAALYALAMLLAVRPLMRRLEIVHERHGRLSQNVVAIVFLLVTVSAIATESIGIHALFGAFLMGLVMPKGTQFVRHLSEKIEDFTVVLLLPIFFAYTGLRTDFRLLSGNPQLWLCAGIVTLVACAGKIGGAAVAARLTGMSGRESWAIGILLNTRGLMELVILNIGLELRVIDERVFAMMVVMTIVTTAATMPLLAWIHPTRPAVAVSAQPAEGYAVLIPVSLPKSGGPLVELADGLIGHNRDRGRVHALHLRRPPDHDAYRSGLDEADVAHDEALAPLLAQARGRGLPVEPLSLVSRDVASDICTIAGERRVDLVLMGFHKPVIGKAMLGGTVHRVLSHCPAHVAVLVDRGLRSARRVLVAFLGTTHDYLSLELACRLARHTGAAVTVLHVVPPLRGTAGRTINAKQAVDRVFDDPAAPTPVVFRVVEDPSPVGVVLYQAQQFDLVIAGVAEEWGLESHLFGWRAERLARDCPCSLLIVRKGDDGAVPNGPASPAGG